MLCIWLYSRALAKEEIKLEEELVNIEKRKQFAKKLAYGLLLAWIINMAGLIFLFSMMKFEFTILTLISIAPLFLIPIAAIGLFFYKEWGVSLAYFLSIILIISNSLTLNVMGVMVWGIVLAYLHKLRTVSKRVSK
jgi:hypothetical protein